MNLQQHLDKRDLDREQVLGEGGMVPQRLLQSFCVVFTLSMGYSYRRLRMTVTWGLRQAYGARHIDSKGF